MRNRGQPFPRLGWRRRGVTLLEVTLAMGLLVLVSSMTFWFYASVLKTSRGGTDAAYRLRLARVLLDRIATEVRQAAAVAVDKRIGIEGDAQRIALSTYRVPRGHRSIERILSDAPPPAQYDLTKVEYKLAFHEDILHEDGYPYPLGLARVEVLVPRPDRAAEKAAAEAEAGREADDVEEADETLEDPEAELSDDLSGEEDIFGDLFAEDEGERSGGGGGLGPQVNWEELYSPEIRYLRFCYYDGKSWWDNWQVTGESPLPQLVEITVGYEVHPPFGETDKISESESEEDDEFEDPDNPRRLTPGEINEEFCTCRNEDPVDCVPLADDQFSRVIRIPQADALFRSRVSRETQFYVEELSRGAEEEEEQQP